MKWTSRDSLGTSALMATLCEESPQSGWLIFTPCHPLIPSLISLSPRHPLTLEADVPQQPPRDKYSHKPVHIRMLRKQGPVEPVGFGVLAISVVVAKLRAPNLITHQ